MSGSREVVTETAAQRQTVILLGASNLTIGWPDITRVLQEGLLRPIDLFVALGLGRSYIDWSRFAARRLPGIVRSQLFEDLERHLSGETVGSGLQPSAAGGASVPLVLITDLGNDLAYGRSPDQVAMALEQCLQQIQRIDPASRIVVTGLPVQSVERLSWLRFIVARSLLFPASRLTLPAIQDRAAELDRLVRAVTRQHNAVLVEPLPEWYGLDPIHIRRRCRAAAFRHFLQHWPEFEQSVTQSRDRLVRPTLPVVAEWEARGQLRHRQQPHFDTARLRVHGY